MGHNIQNIQDVTNSVQEGHRYINCSPEFSSSKNASFPPKKIFKALNDL